MDFHYIIYVLKSLLISDFRYREIEQILNDSEPEIFSRAYIESLKFNKVHTAQIRMRLRILIDNAYKNGVPLGSELGSFSTPEDAYLFRQRYLRKYKSDLDLITLFNKSALLMITAAVCVFVILIF